MCSFYCKQLFCWPIHVLIGIVNLCTDITSTYFSNVNIVCYSKLPPTNIVSITDISLPFLHSKSSISGTRSDAQVYKICQHQQKTQGMYIFPFFFYCSCYFKIFTSIKRRMSYLSLDTKFEQRNIFFTMQLPSKSLGAQDL